MSLPSIMPLTAINLSHHAYVVVGGTLEDVTRHIEHLQIPIAGNPDVYVRSHETFGIDEARIIKERAGKRALTGRQIFILALSSSTREAQNALLKLLEEPTPDTHFLLCVRNSDVLLPTILSRAEIVVCAYDTKDVSKSALAFLEASVGERLQSIAPLIEAKDKVKAEAFLNDLEKTLVQSNNTKRSSMLSAILETRGYVRDRSSSLKLLFEHLALTI